MNTQQNDTLNNDTQQNDTLHNDNELFYRIAFFNILLSVIVLNILILVVLTLSNICSTREGSLVSLANNRLVGKNVWDQQASLLCLAVSDKQRV